MADVSFSSAAAAYASGIADAVQAPTGSAPAERAASGFADLVSDALAAARATGAQAEHDSMRAIAGEVGLHEVVTWVTNAEVTLQTVVALRDRVINAYNDILRMPI